MWACATEAGSGVERCKQITNIAENKAINNLIVARNAAKTKNLQQQKKGWKCVIEVGVERCKLHIMVIGHVP